MTGRLVLSPGYPKKLLSGLLVAGVAVGLAWFDPATALWFSAPLALLWLLVTGLTRPAERLLDRLRGERLHRRRRAPRAAGLPRLPIVIARVGRLIAAALAVRPPPVRIPSFN